MPAMQPEKGASPSNRSRWLGSTDTSYCDRYFSLFEQATVQTEENQSRNKEMPSIIYFYFSKVIFLTSLSSLKKEMFRGGKRIPPWFCFFFPHSDKKVHARYCRHLSLWLPSCFMFRVFLFIWTESPRCVCRPHDDIDQEAASVIFPMFVRRDLCTNNTYGTSTCCC